MDKNLKNIIEKIPFDLSGYFDGSQVNEIRIRAGSNIKIFSDGRYITVKNTLITQKELEDIFLKFCDYTLSAYRDQISCGFITLPGGHRVGIGGKFICTESEIVLNRVSSLIIRIANQVDYKYDSLLMHFSAGLLIAGPPHSGKTTLLRSICRNTGVNRVVCDERNEFHDCSTYCDIISGVNKTIAIAQAVRSMNPDIIICDEIGGESEAQQLLSFMNTGVRFICSVHAENVDRLWLKPNIRLLLENRVFDKIVLLGRDEETYFIKETVNV
ncbi:MAG: Flp pilus assembly complex ATPase component TadA [Oscillospiraceae bacterium]|nr:Flp pilus assembly complex ATPase component TadA [Oscillospiraceae bacterium]